MININFLEELSKYNLDEETYNLVCLDIDAKLNGENDLDWSEIRDKYGIDCNADTIRKASSTPFGGKFRTEYLKEKLGSQNKTYSYKDDLETKLEDLRKERIKLQTANIERNKIDRFEARHEYFYEQIGMYIKSNEYKKLEPLFVPKNKNIKYLLGIADVHANANWSTMTNEFNMNVVKERFKKLLNDTVVFIKEKQLDEFNIALLGDMIDGCLRMSNLQSMDTTVSKSIADISDIIIDFVDQIVEKTHVHINLYDVVYGNHSMPRFLQNYDVREDLGYTINRYIRTGLKKNENVTIFSPDDNDMYLDFNIWDFNFIGYHGHTEKNNSDAIKDLTLQRRKLYDYAICGHMHSNKGTTNTVGGSYDVETIQFPSFVGDDPYSNSIHKISKSACMICGFDKEKGWIETYKFILN